MRTMRGVWVTCVLLFAAGIRAQEATPTVAERLIDVLTANGTLDTEDGVTLRLIADARRRAARLDESVDELVARSGRGARWTTTDERFSLRIGGRIMLRFSHEDRTPDFRTRAARVRFDGHVFDKWLTYRLQLNVAGDEADTTVSGATVSSSNELAETKDAYVDAAFATSLNLRAGQFKVPYSRQAITGQARMQFVDRAVTNQVFGRGRDVGMMLHGTGLGERDDILEWRLGAFDGEGENRTNDDAGLLWVGRVAAHPFGAVAYRESDVGQSDSVRLAIAANAWVHQDDGHANAGDDWAIGVDAALRWRGLFILGELHWREDARAPGPDAEALGWLVQLGWFVVPDTLELGVRTAHVDWDHNGDGDAALREYLFVVGWFSHAHDLKVQVDFGHVEEHAGDRDDNVDGWRLRVQLQLIL